MQLTLDIPEKYLIFQSPTELVRLLKLNTAIDLYRQGRFSASAAAEFVGDLDRYEFLYECRQRGIEPPQTYESTDELQAEIEMLARKLA
ncbi:MAG: UPF0175 family protein [Candidatus Thiothrix putei]|uniref:UPF0175 family protein n=1 Tax=Candidatus Thiothrix putei TaxID=3080811 RepID=A0AA95KK21_9GAMM|nr:MAG: UPF0175 family protein [Candidatus Thiothrix putei]